jgi:hypothetical protein
MLRWAAGRRVDDQIALEATGNSDEILAQLLAAYFLPPLWPPDERIWSLRRQVTRRAHLVRAARPRIHLGQPAAIGVPGVAHVIRQLTDVKSRCRHGSSVNHGCFTLKIGARMPIRPLPSADTS